MILVAEFDTWFERSPNTCDTCRYGLGAIPTDFVPLKVAGMGFLCPACKASIGWRS